ncbi:MAG: 50S ribosomal protein L31 [Candidatus Hadarchaeum yellowstonense]|jgi:large subunit ribosomal protein L31e|uniref:Large ribosomal subunit protein eL31 n=1 Tax=Hadarchaeum yellowstonense TaxID=1776334 RepID=A0A147JVL8_HADYE|nr:MAG: 50S ribosomal protein L31 [Candidatus Hadarchaeum yellowstonense]
MPEEKIFVIPLREVKRAPRYRRTSRAVKLIKEYLTRHMKSERVKLDPALNEKLWECGQEKPPAKIRVKAVKDEDGLVKAFPAE